MRAGHRALRRRLPCAGVPLHVDAAQSGGQAAARCRGHRLLSASPRTSSVGRRASARCTWRRARGRHRGADRRRRPGAGPACRHARRRIRLPASAMACGSPPTKGEAKRCALRCLRERLWAGAVRSAGRRAQWPSDAARRRHPQCHVRRRGRREPVPRAAGAHRVHRVGVQLAQRRALLSCCAPSAVTRAAGAELAAVQSRRGVDRRPTSMLAIAAVRRVHAPLWAESPARPPPTADWLAGAARIVSGEAGAVRLGTWVRWRWRIDGRPGRERGAVCRSMAARIPVPRAASSRSAGRRSRGTPLRPAHPRNGSRS